MSLARVFVPQETLELWVAEGRAQLQGETLLLGQIPMQLEGALRFMAEVAEGGDAERLVGRVKTLTQVAELGGEHASTSVVLGDNAYEVVEGFLASPDMTQAAHENEQLLSLFAEP